MHTPERAKSLSSDSEMQSSVPFAASMILEVVPSPVRSFLQIAFHYLFTRRNEHTIVIDENCGISRNEIFHAARIYLRTKISPSTRRFKVNMTSRHKNLNIDIEPGQEVTDTFENFHLKWKLISMKPKDKGPGYGEKRCFELIFNKKFNERVLKDYLPSVLAKSKEIKKNDKVLKLYTKNGLSERKKEGGGGIWGSINLEHPATFDTLAMDPGLKKAIMNDLKRFVNRRDFYKKVGKAWKRGYFLYGPPGTGKSSLIGAMANYLQFDVYDVELTRLHSNHELRTIMLSTTNRSIIVFEDIDCSLEEMQDQTEDINQRVEMQLLGYPPSETKLTLSGLLNTIDGVWSSCGDERIIVFTANRKDRIDPALLRPGRMDMQIHMSYCSAKGFKFLASNYLDICSDHERFGEIENLIKNVEVTPAEVAEELMRSEDADVALDGVVNLLKRKQIEANKIKEEKTSAPEHQQAKRLKTVCPKKRVVRKCRENGCKMSARSCCSNLIIARNIEMDPNSVKSTVSNLAFGNVMAAAARDYQKDPELEKLHADRIAALKKEAEKRQALKNQGHGDWRAQGDN
ncbi:hypothetical protein F0562_006365 [Nyssa sinensis]|uniref:AAA+ ATPase domain-containing protein n=1 Tax=Nyssa sinensis TaxID=561372 RepID=A0A5J5ANY0_9ASTE|nr:hypothetical protein F0562_006365 [Nyssa sinensis]